MTSPEYEQMAWLASKMRTLIETAEFDAYIRHLESVEQEWVERCVTSSKDDFERIAGVIQGLRMAGHIPGQLIAHFQKMQDHEPPRKSVLAPRPVA